jgi:hypothetical protein
MRRIGHLLLRDCQECGRETDGESLCASCSEWAGARIPRSGARRLVIAPSVRPAHSDISRLRSEKREAS